MQQECLVYQREPKVGEKLLIEHRHNGVVTEQQVRVIRTRHLPSLDMIVRYVDEKEAGSPDAEQFNLYFGINCFGSSPNIKTWIED